ncbi:glycoside hydrolase family 35 protein [Caproicibacterium amylolyticum]|uniref:Beta-galactosidase n=1 Tax=Caproicibacterium amylolyticum TaxID=2766537 RepID=A0A7G9WHN2_9FIRM|nr:beta-galactosidase family protein [Caproicibacterium amylolyticum]QNO18194.1 beta-galactosidase [Caproicibacterium amylolyticum]
MTACDHTFEIKDQFYLDNEPFKIISGALHYFRVVPQYWRDRLEKLRALGCNTVETYVPWNLHEPHPGEFCFSGMLDLAQFLHIAKEVGLFAIVRPSPYICGEWEFGGLPGWLLAEDGMKLRCTYPPYLNHVRSYYKKLFSILTPLQIDQGGPILMMQVENEYGAYGDETAYLAALRDCMRENGATVPFITSDGPWGDYLDGGSLPDALPTANFGSKAPAQFPRLQKRIGSAPLMCTEFWVGWFDAWGDKAHHTTDAQTCAQELDAILQRGSVNIYMFHGGTNFGFTNGANYYGHLQPDVTSYDYDALLTENGELTPKYKAFQNVIAKYAPIPEMKFSAPAAKMDYGTAAVQDSVSLFSVVEEIADCTENPWPLCMEKLGQNFGYTLYVSDLNPNVSIEKLELTGANDRAQIFFNHKPYLTLYDRELLKEYPVAPALGTRSQLEILTENMGRVNYGPRMEHQRKGIDGAVLLNGHGHAGWKMYTLPMDAEAVQKIDFSKPHCEGTPAFYRIPFTVEKAGDTFLDLTGWGKGCAVLNGFQLGRFWEIGPQKRLYVPAPILKLGENELILFETEGKTGSTVAFRSKPDLG